MKDARQRGGMWKSMTGDRFFHLVFTFPEQGHLANKALWLSGALGVWGM